MTIVATKDLAALRVAANAIIDAAAEAQRQLYITPGYGQAMVCMELAAEAAAYSVSPSGTYPLLAAQVGSVAADIAGVAAAVIATATAWKTAAAAIETKRMGAKVTVAAAATPAAIIAATVISWSA